MNMDNMTWAEFVKHVEEQMEKQGIDKDSVQVRNINVTDPYLDFSPIEVEETEDGLVVFN